MKKIAILLVIFVLTSCNDKDLTTEVTGINLATIETPATAIFHGDPAPTLYHDMPLAQQNSIVAVCGVKSGKCFCSGTIISPHLVLTASHCVIELASGFPTKEAGDIEIRIGQNNLHYEKRLAVQEVYTKNYMTAGYNHDVALLRLTEGDNTTIKIGINSINTKDLKDKKLQACGFGLTELYDLYEFHDRYFTTMTFKEELEDHTYMLKAKKTGVGEGDSGSPLLYDDGDGIKVIAVASHGEGISEAGDPDAGMTT